MARKDEKLKVLSNSEISSGYYKLTLRSSFISKNSRPGQFCMLKVPAVFLRRPLSISGVGINTVEFVYKTIGKGTKALARMKKGDEIVVLGPLGSGYDIKAINNKTPIFVCGGTGVASLRFLASKLRKKGKLFYGAKKKSDLACRADFKGWEQHITTEDGSFGSRGFITDLLQEYLEADKGKYIIYTCGPEAMMEKVASIAQDNLISGYASMEETMACGLGNCQGCAVKVSGRHRMACSDGPVFRLKEIEWR